MQEKTDSDTENSDTENSETENSETNVSSEQIDDNDEKDRNSETNVSSENEQMSDTGEELAVDEQPEAENGKTHKSLESNGTQERINDLLTFIGDTNTMDEKEYYCMNRDEYVDEVLSLIFIENNVDGLYSSQIEKYIELEGESIASNRIRYAKTIREYTDQVQKIREELQTLKQVYFGTAATDATDATLDYKSNEIWFGDMISQDNEKRQKQTQRVQLSQSFMEKVNHISKKLQMMLSFNIKKTIPRQEYLYVCRVSIPSKGLLLELEEMESRFFRTFPCFTKDTLSKLNEQLDEEETNLPEYYKTFNDIKMKMEKQTRHVVQLIQKNTFTAHYKNYTLSALENRLVKMIECVYFVEVLLSDLKRFESNDLETTRGVYFVVNLALEFMKFAPKTLEDKLLKKRCRRFIESVDTLSTNIASIETNCGLREMYSEIQVILQHIKLIIAKIQSSCVMISQTITTGELVKTIDNLLSDGFICEVIFPLYVERIYRLCASAMNMEHVMFSQVIIVQHFTERLEKISTDSHFSEEMRDFLDTNVVNPLDQIASNINTLLLDDIHSHASYVIEMFLEKFKSVITYWVTGKRDKNQTWTWNGITTDQQLLTYQKDDMIACLTIFIEKIKSIKPINSYMQVHLNYLSTLVNNNSNSSGLVVSNVSTNLQPNNPDTTAYTVDNPFRKKWLEDGLQFFEYLCNFVFDTSCDQEMTDIESSLRLLIVDLSENQQDFETHFNKILETHKQAKKEFASLDEISKCVDSQIYKANNTYRDGKSSTSTSTITTSCTTEEGVNPNDPIYKNCIIHLQKLSRMLVDNQQFKCLVVEATDKATHIQVVEIPRIFELNQAYVSYALERQQGYLSKLEEQTNVDEHCEYIRANEIVMAAESVINSKSLGETLDWIVMLLDDMHNLRKHLEKIQTVADFDVEEMINQCPEFKAYSRDTKREPMLWFVSDSQSIAMQDDNFQQVVKLTDIAKLSLQDIIPFKQFQPSGAITVDTNVQDKPIGEKSEIKSLTYMINRLVQLVNDWVEKHMLNCNTISSQIDKNQQLIKAQIKACKLKKTNLSTFARQENIKEFNDLVLDLLSSGAFKDFEEGVNECERLENDFKQNAETLILRLEKVENQLQLQIHIQDQTSKPNAVLVHADTRTLLNNNCIKKLNESIAICTQMISELTTKRQTCHDDFDSIWNELNTETGNLVIHNMNIWIYLMDLVMKKHDVYLESIQIKLTEIWDGRVDTCVKSADFQDGTNTKVAEDIVRVQDGIFQNMEYRFSICIKNSPLDITSAYNLVRQMNTRIYQLGILVSPYNITPHLQKVVTYQIKIRLAFWTAKCNGYNELIKSKELEIKTKTKFDADLDKMDAYLKQLQEFHETLQLYKDIHENFDETAKQDSTILNFWSLLQKIDMHEEKTLSHIATDKGASVEQEERAKIVISNINETKKQIMGYCRLYCDDLINWVFNTNEKWTGTLSDWTQQFTDASTILLKYQNGENTVSIGGGLINFTLFPMQTLYQSFLKIKSVNQQRETDWLIGHELPIMRKIIHWWNDKDNILKNGFSTETAKMALLDLTSSTKSSSIVGNVSSVLSSVVSSLFSSGQQTTQQPETPTEKQILYLQKKYDDALQAFAEQLEKCIRLWEDKKTFPLTRFQEEDSQCNVRFENMYSFMKFQPAQYLRIGSKRIIWDTVEMKQYVVDCIQIDQLMNELQSIINTEVVEAIFKDCVVYFLANGRSGDDYDPFVKDVIQYIMESWSRFQQVAEQRLEFVCSISHIYEYRLSCLFAFIRLHSVIPYNYRLETDITQYTDMSSELDYIVRCCVCFSNKMGVQFDDKYTSVTNRLFKLLNDSRTSLKCVPLTMSEFLQRKGIPQDVQTIAHCVMGSNQSYFENLTEKEFVTLIVHTASLFTFHNPVRDNASSIKNAGDLRRLLTRYNPDYYPIGEYSSTKQMLFLYTLFHLISDKIC